MKMDAAVLWNTQQDWTVEQLDWTAPRRARSWSAGRRAAYVTPTSTPAPATCRSPFPSWAVTKEPVWSRRSARAYGICVPAIMW